MKNILSITILLSGLTMVSCKKNISDLNNNPKLPVTVGSAPLFTNAAANLSDLMAHTNVNFNNSPADGRRASRKLPTVRPWKVSTAGHPMQDADVKTPLAWGPKRRSRTIGGVDFDVVVGQIGRPQLSGR